MTLYPDVASHIGIIIVISVFLAMERKAFDTSRMNVSLLIIDAVSKFLFLPASGKIPTKRTKEDKGMRSVFTAATKSFVFGFAIVLFLTLNQAVARADTVVINGLTVGSYINSIFLTPSATLLGLDV